MSVMEFLREYDQSLLIALYEHLRLVGIALLIATAIAIPLGVWIARRERVAGAVLLLLNAIQTIPNIALFGLMIPILAMIDRGIGPFPAAVAMVLYALLPMTRNTYVAIREVPAAALDAARGMGMTERQILLRVALPLAAPGIITGVRIAAGMSIGVAAIAAYIGAGGLGLFIVRGIQTTWNMMTIAGAAGIALLALVVELLLGAAERALRPKGMRKEETR